MNEKQTISGFPVVLDASLQPDEVEFRSPTERFRFSIKTADDMKRAVATNVSMAIDVIALAPNLMEQFQRSDRRH